MERQYDLVMLNMSTMPDWQSGVVNRNYFILNEFAKRQQIRKIIAIDFLPKRLKTAIKFYWKNIVAPAKKYEVIFGDLTSLCYQQTEKIFVYATIDSVWSWQRAALEMRELEEKLNLKNIILWSYNPMFTQLIGKLKEELFVFDTVDNWATHSQYKKLMPAKKLQDNYQIIAQKADLIFTVSENLVDYYKQFDRTQDVYYVPNGVDFEHFNKSVDKNIETSLDKIKKPIIGYVGTINSDRVDLDLIEYLAQKNSDKIIALLGPVWHDSVKKVDYLSNKYENIICSGRIKWFDMPAYLRKFSLAIVPHKNNEFIASTNPMKIYDYLACGLPIVSTQKSGHDNIDRIINLQTDYEKFNQAVQEELKNIKYEQILQRKEIAQEYDWQKKVDFMLQKINRKFEEK